MPSARYTARVAGWSISPTTMAQGASPLAREAGVVTGPAAATAPAACIVGAGAIGAVSVLGACVAPGATPIRLPTVKRGDVVFSPGTILLLFPPTPDIPGAGAPALPASRVLRHTLSL